MSEMRLKYFLDLVSNLGPKAQAEAKLVEDAQKRMDAAVGKTADKILGLERTITKIGQNTSTERQIGYLQRLGQAADAAQQKMLRLRQAVAQGIDKAPERFGELAGGYYGAKKVMAPPIQAFSSLEAATQDLKISMLDAQGKVSRDFGKISEEATKLGNQLPGTTKDFMMAARALQTQGVPSSVIANGGLRASSYVGALLDMNQSQSAEVIAKLREAHGLKEDEQVKAADLVQRGFFGFGIKPQEYLETAKYASATYNTMGITGFDKMRETLAIQGMAANVGLESSSFGTNYAMMLKRLSQVDGRANRNSKEAREVRELMGEHGIKMEFYDDAGEFKGNRNMLEQLAQLKKLNPLQQTKVIDKLFGAEAGRPAQIMVQKGLEGYDAAMKTITSQASLDQRIDMKMETFAAKLEALGGTIENVMAKIGSQAGNAAKPLMDGANTAFGPFGDFIDSHPGAGTAMLGLGGAAGAYLSGRVGGALWKSLVLRGAPAAGSVAGGVAEGAVAGGATAASATASGISSAARAAKMLKYGGITAGIAALLEGTAVMADPNADKARELTRIGVTTGTGLLGGAAAGALAGSVVPGLGTIIGAIAGGLAGNYGSGALFDMAWAKPKARVMGMGWRGAGFDDPRRLDRGGGDALLTMPDIKIGEGVLRLDVHVTNDGVSTIPTVLQQPSLIRINPGATNPGSLR